ncbi:MAG: tripartite tricarboxylate transporter TctB family protein [Thermodesulfobacteriota bacterium]|nr:tripartite tricarboxylate transporter TctB family protein [Thermodesulfobacteriota bacterium]
MGEKFVTGLILMIAVVCYGVATKIPPPLVESPLSAGFWPKLILILLIAASGIQVTKLLLRKKEVEERLAKEIGEERKKEEEETGERKVFSLLVSGVIISFLYIYILRWAGFIITTPVFMAAFMYITGFRKKLMLAVVPLITLTVFLLMFVKATYIPLPRGYGIFRSISLLFY